MDATFETKYGNKAGTDEWLTPPELIKKLGEFDLDPCSPIKRPWDTAKKHYTVLDDGLIQKWEGRVFCNPPYGDKAKEWLVKCAEHGIFCFKSCIHTYIYLNKNFNYRSLPFINLHTSALTDSLY